MAIQKQAKGAKKGKKGQKRKITEPFQRKEWYQVKAPAHFKRNVFAWTPVNKTAGTKLSADSLKGRVFEVNLADLNENPQDGFRKMKYCVEEIQGRYCLSNFHGMDMTRDSVCMYIRKWQSLLECSVDVKTQDGYTIRMFCLGFTKKRDLQKKKTCYAQTAQVKQIRKKMMDIMTSHAQKSELKDLVHKFISGSIGKEIIKQCAPIFPLKNVVIRKVKVLKKPKFDVVKLMELHNPKNAPVESRKEDDTATNKLTQEVDKA